MRKADVQDFEALASPDEAVRAAAAAALDGLPKAHFEKHPIGKFQYSFAQTRDLVRAWHASGSDMVRAWIAQALLLTQNAQPEIEEIMLASVPIGRQWQPGLLYYASVRAHRIPGAKELVKSFHAHPDPALRAACAQGLNAMRSDKHLDYAADMPVLRRLLVDTDPSARQGAVHAIEDFEELGREDYEALLDLENMDSGSARHYARERMKKIAARRPDCAPESFAPRVPVLRTDGCYTIATAEVTADGRWVTCVCLRFLPGGRVEALGTNKPPRDLPALLPSAPGAALGAGTVTQDGASFRLTLPLHEKLVSARGTIDADVIELAFEGRGPVPNGKYQYIHLDWDQSAPALAAPEPARKGKKAPGGIPGFEIPAPQSLTVSDAAKWYHQLVARLPQMLDAGTDDAQRLAQAWNLKSRIQAAAAASLYDQKGLKLEFLAKLPVPGLADLLQAAGGDPREALRALLDIPLHERRAFPGTIGEAVGMTYWDGRNTYVMTEEGWALQQPAGA